MPTAIAITPSQFDVGDTVTLSGTGFGASTGEVKIGSVSQGIVSWTTTEVVFVASRGSNSMGLARVDVFLNLDAPPIYTSVTAFGWGQSASGGATSAEGGTITGPAPLCVFFDATETTHSDASIYCFHECGFHHDFGYASPTSPGSWTYSSKPMGNQIGGPVTAHVYKTAGTYVYSVRGQDASGNRLDRYINIVVLDEDTYWTTGGRTTTTIATTTGAWSSWSSNKRYLLNRGSSYTARGSIDLRNLQNVCIKATGSGAKPVITNAYVDNNTSASSALTGANIIFRNLNATGSLAAPIHGKDVLWLECDAKDAASGSSTLGRYTAYPAVSWERPTRLCWQECVFDELTTDYPYLTQQWQVMWMGNYVTNPQFHGLRIYASYGFVGHNRHLNTASGSHALTLRAVGLDDSSQIITSTTQSPASRFVVIADNYLAEIDDIGGACLQISPASAGVVESLEDCLAERTRYGARTSPPSTWSLVQGCRRITVRDEVYDSGASNGLKATVNYGVVPSAWANGPWWSTNWNETVDGTYRKAAPASVLPDKAGT